MSRQEEEAAVAAAATEAQKIETTLTDLSIKSINRRFVTFLCELDVFNHYFFDLPITDISYTLKSAGRVVASGMVPDPGWIKAGTTTKVEVTVEVRYDFLISLIKDVGRDWDVDYELDLGLIIDLPLVGNITIPLTRTGEVKLPTLPTLLGELLSPPAVWFVLAILVVAVLVFLFLFLFLKFGSSLLTLSTFGIF